MHTNIFKNLAVMLLLVSISELNAQGWYNTYNGPGNNQDIAAAITVDDSGNVYVTGYSRSGSSQYTEDLTTIKRDKFGVREWVSRINGGLDNYDRGYSIVVDNEQNVIVAGFTYGTINPCCSQEDYALIKYKPDGNIDWSQFYDGPSSDHDIAYAVAVDDGGNIYVTGGSWTYGNNYDIRTIKYTGQGDSVWSALFNSGPGWDKGRSIAVDGIGNVYVSGTSNEYVNANIITLKYSPSGSEAWVMVYDGLAHGADYGRSMVIDNAGNVYVAGTVYNGSPAYNGSGYDICAIKYNTSGSLVWVRELTSPGANPDELNDIAVDTDGNVYVTGYLWEGDPQLSSDCITIKYKPDGLTDWTSYYGKPDTADIGHSIAIDFEGNVYVTGISNENIFTIKYDNDGNELWMKEETNGGYQVGTDIVIDNEENIYVSGYGENFPGNYDFITIKYANTNTGIDNSSEQPQAYRLYQNYPNPFNPSTKIKFTIYDLRFTTLKVYDILGNEIGMLVNEEKPAGIYEVEFSGRELTSGVYFYQLKAGDFIQTKKMILVK